MLWKLVLLLTVVPIIELVLLIKLSHLTGILFTVLVIVGTGVVGAFLARREGLRALRRIGEEMSRGELPADGLLDGAMILVAGALLVTPGLLTDSVGFLLLLPPGRAMLRKALKAWIRRKIETGQVDFYSHMGFRPISDEPPPGSPPIEDEPPEE